MWDYNNKKKGKGIKRKMKMVILDWDGKLVDSGDFINRWMEESFEDEGFDKKEVEDKY